MKRKKIVKAYLSDEEYAQVVHASETTGLTISKFVKNVCIPGVPAALTMKIMNLP